MPFSYNSTSSDIALVVIPRTAMVTPHQAMEDTETRMADMVDMETMVDTETMADMAEAMAKDMAMEMVMDTEDTEMAMVTMVMEMAMATMVMDLTDTQAHTDPTPAMDHMVTENKRMLIHSPLFNNHY